MGKLSILVLCSVAANVWAADDKPLAICKEAKAITYVQEKAIDRVKELRIFRDTKANGYYRLDFVELEKGGGKEENFLAIPGKNCAGIPAQKLTCSNTFSDKEGTFEKTFQVLITKLLDTVPVAAVTISTRRIGAKDKPRVESWAFSCPEISASIWEKSRGWVEKAKGWVPKLPKIPGN